MRRHPMAPVNVAGISVATSGTDYIAPAADFAALMRAAGCRPGRSHLSQLQALPSRGAVIKYGRGSPGSCHEKTSDDAGRAAAPQHHTR